MGEEMRIGELAKQAGTTQRTIRYYHNIGLLPPAYREGHGQHYYTGETVTRLRKIEQLKKIGLSLGEIGSVIDLYFSDPSGLQPKRKILAILRKHLADTDAKIDALEAFRSEIASHIERFERWLKERGH